MNNIRYPPGADEQAQLLEDLKLLTLETEDTLTPGCGGCTLCAGAETVGSATFSDARLLNILAANDWEPRRAAYAVLLRKAQRSDIRFPSGLTLPDMAQYYLRLARQVRPNGSRTVRRADGV